MEVHLEGGARRGRGGGNPRGCWTCLSLKLSPEEAFLRSRISGSFWWYQVWSSPGGKAAAIEVCWLVVPRHSYILIKVTFKFRLLYREKLLSTKLSEILTKSLFFCTFWTARLAFEETNARLWGMFARCEMWLVCATWQQKQQLSRGVLTSHIFKWTKLDSLSERKIIKTFFCISKYGAHQFQRTPLLSVSCKINHFPTTAAELLKALCFHIPNNFFCYHIPKISF